MTAMEESGLAARGFTALLMRALRYRVHVYKTDAELSEGTDR